MRSAKLFTLEEYLTTAYSPDCDYVDGHLEKRNLGKTPHSGLVTELITYLNGRRKQWSIRVWASQRVQTAATRIRVPDICVTVGCPAEPIFRTAPLLCIEVLSSEDRMPRVEKRLQEYLDMGVPFVWVVDPVSHAAWIYSAAGRQSATDGLLRTSEPEIVVPLDELFAGAEE